MLQVLQNGVSIDKNGEKVYLQDVYNQESETGEEEKFKEIIKLIESRQNEKAENILNKLLKENKDDFYTHQLLDRKSVV